MKVLKRDGTIDIFQIGKIEKALENAFKSCGYETYNEDVIKCVKQNYDTNLDIVVGVEDIQDTVENCLMASHPDVAKHYIIYRYEHKLIRESRDSLTKAISRKLMADNIENQNANVDEFSFGGRMGEAGRVVTKDYALKYCMSRKSRKNHLNNEIYIHDLDSYAVGMHNCYHSNTKFITKNGVVRFGDCCDGQQVEVVDMNGRWKSATVRKYGKQKMYNLTFKCGLTYKTVTCTRNHRWVLENGKFTDNIQIGDKLWKTHEIDTNYIKNEKLWCFGFVIGDGCDYRMYSKDHKKITNMMMNVKLCGDKNKYSNIFLRNGWSIREKNNNNDTVFINRGNGAFKQAFLDNELWKIMSYDDLCNIFEGYIAADGHKKKNGSVMIMTSDERIKKFIEYTASTVGYYLWSQKTAIEDTNYKENRIRYEFYLTKKQTISNWKLVDIKASRNGTNGYMEAWCVEEPTTHTFTLDGGIVTGNCLSIPFDDLLKDGFNTRQTDVRPASSINTAFQLVAVIFQLQSLQQFGGVSATHLDWTMVPYFRLSFYKHFKNGLKYIAKDNEKVELFSSLDKNLVRDTSINDKMYTDNVDCYNYALDCTIKELEQAVEGMYHNLNTLQSRSGNQLPFTSINYGTCTLPEGRYVIQKLLEGSIKGVGKHHVTPIFPCGIFQLMKGVNRKQGDKNYDLYQLALKSTSQRLYPNYANVDWSGNEGYDKNDPRTYFSTMGCHIKDTMIIMADGTKKPVQDIVVGDKVMGVNNEIRTVQSLIRGNDKMFKVEQSRGENYIVNEGHILSLRYNSKKTYKGIQYGDIVNMSVHDFLLLSNNAKKNFRGYKESYELSEKEYKIPPYILGLWLGDGNSHNTRISVNANEIKIIEDLRVFAESIDRKINVKKEKDEECFIVDITDKERLNNKEGNKFRRALIEYDLIKNKHIPECYFYGSKAQRSALLAGLINSDGWVRKGRGRQTINIGNTNLDIIYGAKRLADSLGYKTRIIKARDKSIGVGICEGCELKPYYHLSIALFDDPNLMENKKIQFDKRTKRNLIDSVITISEYGVDDFYGFELDGDRLYMIEDGTVTHNCRTANGFDINGFGQLKDGRGNICPVTIILPTIAMEADRDVEKFMKLLTKKIEEAKDMLLERFEWICKQNPKSASFMWENGIMKGYITEEGIRSALKHGTLALGQLGLAETLQLLIGKDHTTEEGMDLAIRIETLFNEKCTDYKNKYKLNFGVYYTPAENLCHTALKAFRNTYGIIENVSDREYFTNSIHVPVWKNMNPFEKIDIESKLTGFSSAGCITYVELPSTTKHNIEALETIVNYAMDKDIPYFAINVPNDMCCTCGYTDEFNNECPMCHSKDIKHLRRVTGYLTGSYLTSFNYGKQKEVEDRIKHIKN